MNNPCMYIKFYITTGGINRFSKTEKPASCWKGGLFCYKKYLFIVFLLLRFNLLLLAHIVV